LASFFFFSSEAKDTLRCRNDSFATTDKMAVTYAFALPLRVAEGVLAIIILGLTAYDASAWSGPWHSWSPAEINYTIFVSVWTLLALIYLILAPLHFPTAAHKFGVLAAEAVTMIFWFAAWIALASMLGNWGCGQSWGPCRAATAATVFGAFEWLLWCATTVMAALHVFRTDRHHDKHDPAMEVQPHPGT